MSSSHQGEVALVTGGASGMGRAAGERLSKLGVIVFALDLPKAVETAAKENAAIKFRVADITSEEQVTKVLEEIRATHKRLDYLINCAGIFHMEMVYDVEKNKSHDLEAFAKVLQVNVVGTFNVIRLAIPIMRKNQPSGPDGQRGVIINVSSVARSDSPAGLAAYSASKAAIAGITTPLAKEFGSSGIRVVTIAPGPVYTPMISHIPFLCEGLTRVQFPKRLGNVEEFAHLVQSIIENTSINATTIRLDGGYRHYTGNESQIPKQK